MNGYVVKKTISQKQTTTTVMNPAACTRAIPNVTLGVGWINFLDGMHSPMDSTETDYKKVPSGMNLWKLHLRGLDFT